MDTFVGLQLSFQEFENSSDWGRWGTGFTTQHLSRKQVWPTKGSWRPRCHPRLLCTLKEIEKLNELPPSSTRLPRVAGGPVGLPGSAVLTGGRKNGRWLGAAWTAEGSRTVVGVADGGRDTRSEDMADSLARQASKKEI